MTRPSLNEITSLEELAAWAASNHQGGFMPAEWMPLLQRAALIGTDMLIEKMKQQSES